MKLNHTAGHALTALLLIGSVGLPLSAQTRLNISASNCIPRSADEFDESGGGPDGFRWDRSLMINKDDDENQDLICAVPFDHLLRRSNGTIPAFSIVVEVYDGHPSNSVRAFLYSTASSTFHDSASTLGPDIGTRSLTLTWSPTPATMPRFVWLLITVPDLENGRTSGVVGYSIRRD
jgi:hypothetical protein